jgi:hypothetical protein
MTELRRWSPGQGALRAAVMFGPVVAVLATLLLGDAPPWWLVLVVAGMGAGFAYFPDSAVGAGVFLLVLAWWAMGPGDGLHPAALVAAAGLLVSHLAATVAAYGPGSVPPDPAVLRRWAIRVVLVFPAAVLAWAIATAARDSAEPPPGIWAAGLAGLLAAFVAADVLYARRSEQ